jgi:hypothetical protein
MLHKSICKLFGNKIEKKNELKRSNKNKMWSGKERKGRGCFEEGDEQDPLPFRSENLRDGVLVPSP